MTAAPTHSECDLEVVREGLARQLLEQSGEHLKSIETVRIISRPYSEISILSISTDIGSYRLVLKRITKNPLNAEIFVTEPDQAVVEHKILTRLYENFSAVDGCFVPRPIAVLPELDAHVMEYVDGHDLDQDLRSVHYFSRQVEFRKLQDHLFLCGRWLRHFQQFTGIQHADPSILDRILAHCDHRLQVIEESGDRRCPKDFRRKATEFIEDKVRKLSDTKILATGCHSDFGPWNTLAGPQGVTVIDFFGYRQAPLPVDVLSMLVFLNCLRYGIANSESRIRRLRERFLAGLGPLPDVPQPLVLLCETQQRIMQIAIAVLARSGEGHMRPIRWPESWEQSRSLSANIKWFQMRQQKSSLWPR